MKKLWHALPTYILIAIVSVALFWFVDYFVGEDDSSNRTTPEFTITHYADIVIRDYGTVTVALAGETAPKTVQNFVSLAQSGFYDGLTFHRIVEHYVMQGGDPNGDGSGNSGTFVTGEFYNNGWDNPLPHLRGAVSMAREGGFNTGSCQFFIVHDDALQLDGNYAVFGFVVEGFTEVVDKICAEAEPINTSGYIPPEKQPVIETIRIREAGN
jgi:peptidyl-prolyl cis-trans isomerase B (cyclophilin B)